MKRTAMAISAVPSLSSDSPSSSSTSSLDTRIASNLIGNNILEDDGTGVLIIPAPASSSSSSSISYPSSFSISSRSIPPAPTPPHRYEYMCLFHILDCHHTFTNAEHWKIHVLSHFRTHAPPPVARCPLCPRDTTGATFVSTPDQHAWDLMMDHVDEAHYQAGQTLAGSRPDFELMRYLYSFRIISEDQFKVLQLSPAPGGLGYHRSQDSVRARVGSSDEPFCAPYSRRREERMRGARRGVSVV